MATTQDFRNGMALELDGQLFRIVEFQHVKPGKGGAFVRTKLKNLRTGQVIDRTWNAGEKVQDADIREEAVQFLYAAGDTYHFMNTETYDQFELDAQKLGDEKAFLKEGMVISLTTHEGRPLTAELPTFVELSIRDAEPGVRGNTVSNLYKSATLETGATVQVPLFIGPGDVVKVDTRTGRYVERVSR
ncbi:MAG TPA: elongation factor P [Candidatus Eisenbacteria bacterium]|nr:elongation factor P [Candidatus Eisenbacteria bacterium]